MVRVKEDMTGWVMSEHGVPDSRLTVIRQVEDKIKSNGVHEAQWECECSCEEHNKVIVVGHLLRNGGVRSCGCLRRESAIKNGHNNKKYNKYDLSGNYGVGWTSNTSREFYFDLEDYDKIKDYCWCECISKGYHWLQAKDYKNNKTIMMHQLIYGKYCDHIDRNPLNNQKENLRPSTFSENTQNRGLFKNNISQITGVHYHKSNGMWMAYINKNKKRTHLGYFTNKEDAIVARLNAEVKYFGRFAPQKHLFEQYNITIQNDLDKEIISNDRTN